ncbi:hypothetical protein AEGHOMDF_5036 [Methylobacterium soli]|nr:hypothetical protein AEGHOMDF_5036 [Methylobacterium soli]
MSRVDAFDGPLNPQPCSVPPKGFPPGALRVFPTGRKAIVT